MAYTLGASHTVATSSTITIASPVGLKVTLASIPSAFGSLVRQPTRYVELGELAIGNADGFTSPILLEHQNQLVYPIPDGMTQLGVTLNPPVTAVVQELMGPNPLNSSLMPWDRNPSTVTQQFGGYVGGGNSLLSGGTYTVPSARKFLIGSLFASVTRVTLATSLANTQIYVRRGALTLAYLIDWQNVVGNHVDYAGGVGDLVLLPGEVVSMEMNSQDSGGSHYATASFSGILFDA